LVELNFKNMKKIALFSSLIFLVKIGFAQDLKSKKGENYLPEQKDYCLSIDAAPFLNYAGAIFSNNGAISPSANSLANSPFTITGKYFTKNDFAYRGRIRVGLQSQTFRNNVINNANTQVDTTYTNDTKKVSSNAINLSFGFEKRKGKTRLQGYYGAEAMIMIASGKSSYSYGNNFTNTQTSIFTTDFDTPINTGFQSSLTNTRIGEVKEGNTFGIGARAFAGVEYFILPKISIGAELGWGLMFRNTNDGYFRTEYWDNANSTTKQRQLTKAGGNYLGIDTDNSGGALILNFYF
jgi:hypothetical protein